MQSFLQTAELLAVQGLTSEEKEKPKPPAPIIEDNKLIKTIPSTIRAVNDNATATQAATQTTLEIPTANLLQATAQQLQVSQQLHQHQQQPQSQSQSQHQHHVQTQIQHIQVQQQHQQPQHNPTTGQQVHHQVTTVQQGQHQTLQLQQVTHHSTQQPTQQVQVNTQPQLSTAGIVTLPATHQNTLKKRKITFSDDDDNIYTAETVDYGVKDEQTIVKSKRTPLLIMLRLSIRINIFTKRN